MIIHKSPFPDLVLPPEQTSLPAFLFRDVLPTAVDSSSSSHRLDQPLVLPTPFHPKFNPNPVRPGGKSLSLRDLKILAERWASFLISQPCWSRERQGEDQIDSQQQPVLSLITSNQHDYTAAVLGAHLAHPSHPGREAGVVALHNPSYTPRELADQLCLVRTHAVLCSRKSVGNVLEAVKLAKDVKAEENGPGPQYRLDGEIGVWCFEEDEVREADGKADGNSSRPPSWYSVIPPALEKEASEALWSQHLSSANGSHDAVYCFSSGTSGKPKAVRLSHASLVANVIQATGLMQDRLCTPLFDRWHTEEERGWYDATSQSKRGDESPTHATGAHSLVGKIQEKLTLVATGNRKEQSSESRELHIDVLPQFHCYGLLVAFVAMHTVTPRYILARFSLLLFLHLTSTERCTFSFLVPPILLALSRSPEVEEPWVDLSSLRRVASGAASLPPRLREELWQKRRMRVTDGYGMSEMSPIICLEMVEDWKLPSAEDDEDDNQKEIVKVAGGGGGVGRLAANTFARVLDVNTNEDLPVVESTDDDQTAKKKQGELLLYGPQMMSGYLRNEEANRSTFLAQDSRRWLRTGDIVSLHPGGYVRIHDRSKDVIKVSGFQVSPAELEEVILRGLSSVKDVAVVGVDVKAFKEAAMNKAGADQDGRGEKVEGGTGGEEGPWAFCVPSKEVTGNTGEAGERKNREEESKKVLEYVNSRVTKYKHVKGGE